MSSTIGAAFAAASVALVLVGRRQRRRSRPLVLGGWRSRDGATPVKLMLEARGCPYEHLQFEQGGPPDFSMREWEEQRAELGVDALPFLIDGDIVLCKAGLISRHVARKLGLDGASPAEKTAVELMLDRVEDARDAQLAVVYSKAAFEPAARRYIAGSLPGVLGGFEAALERSRWLVGDAPTAPDFHLYELLDSHREMLPGCLDAYPALREFCGRFEALPGIAAYLESPRHAARPLFNPAANVQ